MSGHLCKFQSDRQRDKNGTRLACIECDSNAHLSLQCCDSKLCSNCWKKLCNKRDWDPDLSKCGNICADDKGIQLQDRHDIDQNNIYERLMISPLKKLCHISDTRWEHGKKSHDRTDKNEAISSDEEPNDSDKEFIANESKDEDYQISESEEEARFTDEEDNDPEPDIREPIISQSQTAEVIEDDILTDLGLRPDKSKQYKRIRQSSQDSDENDDCVIIYPNKKRKDIILDWCVCLLIN